MIKKKSEGDKKPGAKDQLQSFKQWCQKVADSFLTSSSQNAKSISEFREALKSTLLARKKGFLMPDKYALVLNRIHERRSASVKNCKESLFVNVADFRAALRKTVPDLAENLCDDILETLHGLGDILWYKDSEEEILKKYVMLAPDLLISFVRETLNHELFQLSHLKASSLNEPEAEPSHDITICGENDNIKLNRHQSYHALSKDPEFLDRWATGIRCEGRIYHSLLIKLPVWSDIKRHEIDRRIQLVRRYWDDDVLGDVSDEEIERHLTDRRWLMKHMDLMKYYFDEDIGFVPWLAYLVESTERGQNGISELIEELQRYSKERSISDRDAFCLLFDEAKHESLIRCIDFKKYEERGDATNILWIDALVNEREDQQSAAPNSERISNVLSVASGTEEAQFPFSFVDGAFIEEAFIDEREHADAIQLFRKFCKQDCLELTDEEILDVLLDPSRRKAVAEMMDFKKYVEDEDVGNVRWIDELRCRLDRRRNLVVVF
ncbi:hypothetical protein PINS_up004909 [Pythium insidiosum]|nr:hypothetical protein PINS_up004909 [Pythium insidiosum]